MRCGNIGSNRSRFWCVLVLLAVLPDAAACQPGEADDLAIKLGYADGRPAVYFAPREGMKVQLKNIIYDESNEAVAYDLEVDDPTADKLTVTLKPGTETDHASDTYRYKAEINGKARDSFSLQEWGTTEPQGLIAFFPEGMGGYSLRFRGSITQTNVENVFSYDSLGNRSYGEQSFVLEGTTYRFEYSDHQRDDAGNLVGYTAEIVTLTNASPSPGQDAPIEFFDGRVGISLDAVDRSDSYPPQRAFDSVSGGFGPGPFQPPPQLEPDHSYIIIDVAVSRAENGFVFGRFDDMQVHTELIALTADGQEVSSQLIGGAFSAARLEDRTDLSSALTLPPASTIRLVFEIPIASKPSTLRLAYFWGATVDEYQDAAQYTLEVKLPQN